MKAAHQVLLLTALVSLLTPLAVTADESSQCIKSGEWQLPGQTDPVSGSSVYSKAATTSAVLLGEVHSNPEHHRWQLHSLAAIHAHNPKIAIGFEMFPRSVQAVLDRYIAGELTDQELMDETDWAKIWNFPQQYYLPLFQFARMHRLPMIALNVERSLVSTVGSSGWEQVSSELREGVTDPAPASQAYIDNLQQVFDSHRPPATKKHSDHGEDTGDKAAKNEEQNAAFDRFVEAQLTWDRAMAQAISEALESAPEGYTVVSIIGRGHLEYGHGVPHQLDDLGVGDSMVLLPVEETTPCSPLSADLAYAVFGTIELATPEVAAKPRLGVHISNAEDAGVVIDKVVEESVAAESGLKALDTIVAAAGVPTDDTAQLVEVISRQAPGTWLPLTVIRNGEMLEVVARFPAVFE